MWTIDGQQAILETPNLAGTVPLTFPSAGLQFPRIGTTQLATFQCLGISPTESLQTTCSPGDYYAQESQLVVCYQDPTHPAQHIQLQWRQLSPQPSLFMAGLELILSFEVSHATQQTSWVTRSQVDQADLMIAGHETNAPWLPITDLHEAAEPTETHPGNLACMVLCRFPKTEVSYVEMTSPTGASLTSQRSTKPDQYSWGLRLPVDELEKGVILRRRLQGIFLPRKHDTTLAWKAYQAFQEAAPPLN